MKAIKFLLRKNLSKKCTCINIIQAFNLLGNFAISLNFSLFPIIWPYCRYVPVLSQYRTVQ